MSATALAVALAAVAAWLVLLFGYGRLWWRADQRLPAAAPERADWPAVVAVVPARDEAPYVGAAVGSLLAQDYPGRFSVILIDDGSTDGTAEVARAAARAAGAEDRLTVVAGAPLPEGWTGKNWAVARGIEHAAAADPEARYLLLTDADIVHEPRNLRRLVGKAEDEARDLVSLMVLLVCQSPAERLLIPAFVFFFQKLYPFPLVNEPKSRVAGAAGGCILVRRRALEAAGGMAAIRGALIDDCALAARVKAHGPIWLGLATETRSIRPYGGLRGVWTMVARAAYAQLHHSPLLLAGTVAGMAFLYLVPPAAALVGLAAGAWPLAAAGLAGWLGMSMAYAPTLHLYRQPLPAAALLPVAALLFALMTVDSALRHWRGRGGAWKGRTYPSG